MNGASLDHWITGNWGQDRYGVAPGEDAIECIGCGVYLYDDADEIHWDAKNDAYCEGCAVRCLSCEFHLVEGRCEVFDCELVSWDPWHGFKLLAAMLEVSEPCDWCDETRPLTERDGTRDCARCAGYDQDYALSELFARMREVATADEVVAPARGAA